MMDNNISFILTSCGRFDLLERTIASMDPWVFEFAEKILIDDSEHHHPILDHLHDLGMVVLSNPTPKGQHYSIDRAYSQATCPYIFHCEDDWVFDRCPDLEITRYLLDINPRLSQVCFTDLDYAYKCKYPADYEQKIEGLQFTTVHYNGTTFRYPAFSFSRTRPASRSFVLNPHLIKRSTVDRFFPYSQYITEYDLACQAQRKGYTLAYQSPGMCIHIGNQRYISDSHKKKHRLQKSWARVKHFLIRIVSSE